tara:strand:- start:735 stop:1082 length:348 start_codon:yes stop_codon:yes gene_type:complete
MRIIKKNKNFKVKNNKINKTGDIILKNNELVSFIENKKKNEYDIVKKNWGYYVSSSINNRLKSNNFKIALIKNEQDKFFLCAVDSQKLDVFKNYIKKDNQKIVKWLNQNFLLSLI